jgi:DNA-binding transcriptional LysR family regulator
MQRRHEHQNIPTEVLRSFITVVDSGSYTKAASLLGLTQSAVTAQITRLERQLGTEVFAKGTCTLTTRGQVVCGYARRLLAINDQMLSGGAEGIRLGLPAFYSGSHLRSIFQRCRHVHFHCDSVPNLRKQFEAGGLDVFIDLSSTPLSEAVASWTESVSWVSACDFVMPPGPIPFLSWPGSPLEEIALRALYRSSYKTVAVTQDLNSQIQAVQAKLGFAAIAEWAVTDDLKTWKEGLPLLAPMHVGIQKKPNIDGVDTVVKCLVDIVAPEKQATRPVYNLMRDVHALQT